MDRGKRFSKLTGSRNSRIYMDLKDILREHALPFLPAKSLFRFQGVCRDWKLQISTPFFAHNQSLACRSISGFFCQTPGNPPFLISIDPNSCGVPDPSLKFLPVPVDIRSSSNGLLCCQGRTGGRDYYICNPVTQQWTKLPKPSADHGNDPAIVLIFEPSLLNFVAEYKLVCAFQSADFDDAIEFDIYSSSQKSWKVSGEICFSRRAVNPRSGIHANGIIYWSSKNNGGLLAFDLTMNRSLLLHHYYGVNGSMGTIDGKLCTAYPCGETIKVDVLANVHTNTMQMHCRAKMWEEKCSLKLDTGVDPVSTSGSTSGAVMFAGSDTLLIQHGAKYYSFDMKTKKTTLICAASEYDSRCLSYVNSLVSIEKLPLL